MRRCRSFPKGSIRSINHAFDPQCQFCHPALDTAGRWYGGGFGGLASDSGYGLIIDQDGDTIEYVGFAKSGRASGIGAMIFRSPRDMGAIYYEGSFSEGLPEGVVQVEEPGRKPRIRKFRAGIDKGAADPEDLQRLQF